MATVQLAYDEYRAAVSVLVARVARLEQAMRAGVATLRPAQQALVTGLAALRGVRDVTAITVVSEVTTLTRFAGARPVMAYAGLVPREHSSGRGHWRGAITKTGNAHLRRVLVEAAWGYRHRPVTTGRLRLRQHGQPPAVVAVAERAQQRLCARYRTLAARGKAPLFVATTIARELLGYVWAIGQVVEGTAPRAEARMA